MTIGKNISVKITVSKPIYDDSGLYLKIIDCIDIDTVMLECDSYELAYHYRMIYQNTDLRQNRRLILNIAHNTEKFMENFKRLMNKYKNFITEIDKYQVKFLFKISITDIVSGERWDSSSYNHLINIEMIKYEQKEISVGMNWYGIK